MQLILSYDFEQGIRFTVCFLLKYIFQSNSVFRKLYMSGTDIYNILNFCQNFPVLLHPNPNPKGGQEINGALQRLEYLESVSLSVS